MSAVFGEIRMGCVKAILRSNGLLPSPVSNRGTSAIEVVQFLSDLPTVIYITLPPGESSFSEERALHFACILHCVLRIALSGRYCVQLSRRGCNFLL